MYNVKCTNCPYVKVEYGSSTQIKCRYICRGRHSISKHTLRSRNEDNDVYYEHNAHLHFLYLMDRSYVLSTVLTGIMLRTDHQ